MRDAWLLGAVCCAAGCMALAAGAQAADGVVKDAPAKDAPVTITAKKTAVTRKADGVIYDQSNNPQAQSGTAADVLNTVPSVGVTPDGAVTVRGNDNVQVYINGRPSAMMKGESRAATLQSLPGSDIASVEVITNPSARYDSNGGPIVNIVLKKNRKPGSHATLITNIGIGGRANGSVNASHAGDKTDWGFSAGMREDVRETHARDDRRWTNPLTGESGRNVSMSGKPYGRHSANMQITMDRRMDETSDLGLWLWMSVPGSENQMVETRTDFDGADRIVNDYQRIRTGRWRQQDTDTGLYYEKRRDNGAVLKLEAGYSSSISRTTRRYVNAYSLPAGRLTGDGGDFDKDALIDRAKLTYAYPVGRLSQISAGLDWKAETTRFGTVLVRFDPADGLDDATPLSSSRFHVRQTISAAFVTAETMAGSWKLLYGARLENIETRTHQLTAGTVDGSRFASLSPSLHLSRDLTGGRRLSLSLTRSLQRPNARDLDPFIFWNDPQSLISGNPGLKPQEVASLEAGMTFGGDGPDTAGVTAYYRQSDRTITDISRYIADNVVLTTKANSGRGRSGGLELQGARKLSDAVTVTANANLFYSDLLAQDLGGPVFRSTLSYALQGSIDWTISARDRLRIDANANGRSVTAQGTRTGTSNLDIVWTRKLGDSLTVNVTARDVAGGAAVTTYSRTEVVNAVSRSRNAGRIVFVGLNKRFN